MGEELRGISREGREVGGGGGGAGAVRVKGRTRGEKGKETRVRRGVCGGWLGWVGVVIDWCCLDSVVLGWCCAGWVQGWCRVGETLVGFLHCFPFLLLKVV